MASDDQGPADGIATTLAMCTCGRPLADDATKCPYCGKRILSTFTRILIWLSIVAGVVVLLWFFLSQPDLAPAPK